jgi:hypothetical protein
LPIQKERQKIIWSLVLLSASITLVAPSAEARGCGYTPANSGSAEINNSRASCHPACECETIAVGRDSGSDSMGRLGCDRQENAPPAPSSPPEAGGQQAANSSRLEKKLRHSQLPDFNREIYYRNKLEFSLDAGWLPINIPFPLDFLEGAPYVLYPLRYTLVPVVASLRWHVDGVGSPFILRGNWDVTFSGSYTAIPKGAETRYFSYDMGIRRNFVPRNWRATPYVDLRFGLGLIDAKGPLGVYYAQGQDYTFTCNMGAGARYNFNSRYAISAGLNWMHISNANLSAPLYSNYGINVYGPMFGIDMRLGGPRRHAE